MVPPSDRERNHECPQSVRYRLRLPPLAEPKTIPAERDYSNLQQAEPLALGEDHIHHLLQEPTILRYAHPSVPGRPRVTCFSFEVRRYSCH